MSKSPEQFLREFFADQFDAMQSDNPDAFERNFGRWAKLLKFREDAAREDEIAMFFQKFEKHEDIGSTPSDLIQPESYFEADIEEVAEYFDERLAQLTTPNNTTNALEDEEQ